MRETMTEFRFNYIESDQLLSVILQLCEKCCDKLFFTLNSGTIIKIDLTVGLPIYYVRELLGSIVSCFYGTCHCYKSNSLLKAKSVTFFSYKGKIIPYDFYNEEMCNENVECSVTFNITNSVRRQLLKANMKIKTKKQ